MNYTVHAFGWMTVVEADDFDDALRVAQELAPSASLLPSDIARDNIREATPADVEWFEAMTNPIAPPKRTREQKLNAIIAAAGGVNRVEYFDDYPVLILNDGRAFDLHVEVDERIHWYLAGEEIT